MSNIASQFSKSSEVRLGLKLFIILFVILLLLVPLGMIKEIAGERKDRARETEEEIIGMNGGRPAVIGPFLVVPVTIRVRGENDRFVEARSDVVILPEKLSVTGDFKTEMRSRGIYKVPLFSGEVRLDADFQGVRERLASLLAAERYSADWEAAYYAVELFDVRSLKSTPTISKDGGAGVAMKGGESSLAWKGSSSVRARAAIGNSARVTVSLGLGGGGSLNVYPFGESVSCSIASDWKSPSFSGYIVPGTYEISDEGFRASWYIPDSAQPYPDAFLVDNNRSELSDAAFGVDFFQPISVYHKTERAMKYGLLFIVVPFVVFFLFEIFLKRRIHPLQYALIGIADVMFYLILLSLAEHVPFMAAYASGALSVCLLVSFYSGTILGHWKRGLVMVPVLGGIYLYLYVALESEDFALLVGTVGAFAMVAAFMLLTRKIDWYSVSIGGRKTGNDAEIEKETVEDLPDSEGGNP